MPRILLVDDDAETCTFLEELLEAPDRQFVSVQDPDAALAKIRDDSFDLLISDINLNAPRSGLDLLRRFKAEQGGPVVLISGFGTLETAIEAVRAGAFDYISKPFVIADVKRIVDRALEQGARQAEPPAEMPASPRRQPDRPHGADAGGLQADRARRGLGRPGAHRRRKRSRARSSSPGRSTATANARASRSSPSTAARSPTRCSSRSCSGISAGRSPAPWRITRACSSRPAAARCCSTRSATPRPRCRSGCCGSSRKARCGRSAATDRFASPPRVIAATNVPLEQAVAEGRFRQDLYYRLSVIVIRVPPLRERRADIPLLIGSFLEDACKRAGQKKVLSAEALDALMRHPWPGNVRELRNTIERLVVSSRGALIEAFDPDTTAAAARPALRNSRLPICRRSTISSAATSCTCSTPPTAIGPAPPRSSASTAGRCIGWPNGSASS